MYTTQNVHRVAWSSARRTDIVGVNVTILRGLICSHLYRCRGRGIDC